MIGLVDGLATGAHQLVATSGRDRASLDLRAHPITGPVFSGPHETPFVCETESAGLGPALDADCSTATRVRYLYRTVGGEFAPLPDGAKDYPADMARTTTTQGRAVPYIVRKETGTVNRGIYEFALLDDPIAGSREGWNKRLIYNFGGGCTDGWYGLYGTNSPLLQHAILELDRWITAIQADPRHRIAANRPAGLREGCNTRDANPTFIAETQRRDASTRCEQLYPSASFPREIAGEDVAADVVKCRLKQLDFADYRVKFTGAQRARLRAAFPGGVCDWSRPGVSQQPPDGIWQRF